MNLTYPMPSMNDTDEEESRIANDVAQMFSAIQNGATLHEIYGISDDVMEVIYAHAYDFYQKGCMDDAKLFFRFLCSHDMYNAQYALGLGAVYQRQKEYAKAIQMYSLAYAIEPEYARAMFYAGQCYLHLKDKEGAIKSFCKVTGDHVSEAIKKQAQGYLSVLRSEQGVAHA